MSENQIKRIAILTSGGDAPGMNAAIRACVRTAKYYGIETYGIVNGYEGLINADIKPLDRSDVANIIHREGTILKTARSKKFHEAEWRQKAYDNLKAYNIDGMIVIGGNGSYTGAMHLGLEHDFPIVGLPGTIDNDIYGTDFTIGFDTALNTAIDAVDKIRDTAHSHTRIFFIEVMGRHSGYIALHTGIGSGAGTIFLPETEISMEDYFSTLIKKGARKKLFKLVVVAEGNQNGGAIEIAKAVSEKFEEIDAKATVIGHLQRGGSPSANDRVLASRLAFNAVEALRSGHRNVAIGIVSEKVTMTPFEEAISIKK